MILQLQYWFVIASIFVGLAAVFCVDFVVVALAVVVAVAGLGSWFIEPLGIYVLVTFAFITVIRAVFLKDTLHIAANDQEMVVAEKMKAQDQTQKKLKALFERGDVDPADFEVSS